MDFMTTPQPWIALTVASLLLASMAMTYPWLACEPRASQRVERLALGALVIAEFGVGFGCGMLTLSFSLLTNVSLQLAIMCGISFAGAMAGLFRILGDRTEENIRLYPNEEEPSNPSKVEEAHRTTLVASMPPGWTRFLAAHAACAVAAAALFWGGFTLLNQFAPSPTFAIHPALDSRKVVLVEPPVTFLGERDDKSVVATWRGKQIVETKNQRRITDSLLKRRLPAHLHEGNAWMLFAFPSGLLLSFLMVGVVRLRRPVVGLLMPYASMALFGLGVHEATQAQHLMADAHRLREAVIHQAAPMLPSEFVPSVR